jgi:outer membrane protein
MNRLNHCFRSINATVAAVALAAASGVALADGPPAANDVRLGVYSVFFHTSAQDLSGPYVPTGVNLNEKNVETVYVGYVRHFSTHWQTEFVIGLPPDTETVGKGPALLGSVPYSGQTIFKARWIAPSLLLEYAFLDDTHALRPYVGAGFTYASFYDRDATAAGDAATGGPTKVSLTSSIGPAATVGLSYRLSDNWGANVSYSFSDVHTHLTADTAGIIRTTKVSFNPEVLIISVGYTF